MSNVEPLRPGTGRTAAAPTGNRTKWAGGTLPSVTDTKPAGFPNDAGTAVLNLTSDQTSRIRTLLIAMRMGRAVADDVRNQIFGLLSSGQRRMSGTAYFILSVRV